MQSLRLGKPFLQAGVGDRGTGYEGPRPQFSQRRFDMKGSRIAYISSKRGDSDTVCTRDLVTGHELSFYDGTRERVHSVAISSDLVAKVTFSGRLYYTKFSAPQSGQMLVLPSAYIRAVGAHGLAVAVAVGAVGPNAGHVTEILYYDERTFSGLRSIDVAASAKELQDGMRSLNACQILVDSDNKVFDVFTLVYKPGHTIRSLVLLHLRVAFAGDVLSTDKTDALLLPDEHLRDLDFMMTPPAPTGYQGQFRIQIGELGILGTCSLPPLLKFDAIFDSEVGKFIAQERLRPTRLEVIDSSHPHFEPPVLDRVHVQWKTLALGVTAEGVNRDYQEWVEYYTSMNDAFLVRVEVNVLDTTRTRIRIFCFDPKLELHGGKDTGLWEDGKLKPLQALGSSAG